MNSCEVTEAIQNVRSQIMAMSHEELRDLFEKHEKTDLYYLLLNSGHFEANEQSLPPEPMPEV